ncbi:MAG TPA: Stp1/IreP family PP2C-type Ser/Thr phosphatase [Candidatus Hydrogenedentes bacterium]|nr:Stp1/IreP family PP2C-type Ser/Thr phosphatase [Candidatus Hydrogenedentota bacterium]
MAAIPLTRVGPDKGRNYEYHWTGQFLQAYFLSDVGRKREHNEDACVLCAPDNESLAEERGILFAVADGMGGASAGEFASRLTLQTLIDEYYGGRAGAIPARLRRAIERCNQRVFEEAEHNPDYRGMGTTISALVVKDEWGYIAQVGDSRVYVARNDSLFQQITQDHSLVAEQIREGYLTEEEARNHSLRNLITRAVGIKETIETDLFALKMKQGDTILMCSDGLSNMVTDEEMQESLTNGNLQGAGRVLVGRALESGGSDNITVVLVRVVDQPARGYVDDGAEIVRIGRPGILGSLKKLIP